MKRSTDSSMFSVTRRSFAKALGLAALGGIVPGRSAWAAPLRDNRLELVQHSTWVMGQVANVTMAHPDAVHARAVVTQIFAELRRLEAMLSVFDPHSELSAVNAAAGQGDVAVSPELAELLQRSVAIAEHTRGAFDVTVNPLLDLWGFRAHVRRARPTDREIQRALDVVGSRHLALGGNGRVGLQRAGASVDLGGVAVGFALDRCGEILRREGIAHGLLELSGDFLAVGAPPESPDGWEIAVEHPGVAPDRWRVYHLRNSALSTSGNYASTVVYHAHRYGHIFNPERGWPAERLLSATAIAPSALLSDAYSTATFVSGNTARMPSDCTAYLLKS